MKTFSYLALVTAQHQKNSAQLALGGNRALGDYFPILLVLIKEKIGIFTNFGSLLYVSFII